jgi:hypothetical protein
MGPPPSGHGKAWAQNLYRVVSVPPGVILKTVPPELVPPLNVVP